MNLPNSPLSLPDALARRNRLLPLATRSAVLGIGCAVPDNVVTNHDLEKVLQTTDEWIKSRTGISERCVLEPGKATSDMATTAALRACESAGFDPIEVELIILATVTPDHVLPSTAALVQHRLGARRAAGFDLAAACTGFINALMTADALVQSGPFRNALVIGADALSRVIDPESRDTRVLFGDGAGAILLGRGDGRATILDHLAGLDGSGSNAIRIPAGGSRLPTSEETLAARQHFVHMEGREVFRFATEAFPTIVREIVERNGYSLDDIGLLVPHQANLRIIEAGAKRLGIPMDRVAVDIDLHANTGAASIPLALDRALSEREIEPGKLVCFAGFGAGLSWGANLMRWNG